MPTSTLAGGGGTKVFWSQAVSVRRTNAADSIRGILCALHPRPGAGEICNMGHAGFIQMPRLKFQRTQNDRPLSMNSNNRLAAELKSENDGRRRLIQNILISF
ncbi:hypothetical protein [Afipia clevelandensis]|uniref:hypothetical protein n=1 Tax=Afipia clevelandensis TaxID=1034 RepID=UPI00157756D0|nr:hypothetical protein [Afipia clevelandensis]